MDSVLKNYSVKNIVKLRAPSTLREQWLRENTTGPGTAEEPAPTHEEFGFTRTFLVNVAPETDVVAMVEDLKKNPNVEDAQVDYFARISASPNDTFFNGLWGLKTINCAQAWDITKGSADVVVAIVDTGVDLGSSGSVG